jgi:hypothetical protein
MIRNGSIPTTTVTGEKNRTATPRKRLPLTLVLVISLFVGSAFRAAGQTPPLPTAETLLDTFVEKAGGRAVFDRIANRRTTATATMSVLPGPAEVTTYLTKAGPFHVLVESGAIGRVEYGSDGRVVWEINPISGQQIKAGLERSRFMSLYSLDAASRWREVFKSVACTDLVIVEGSPAHKVAIVWLDGYSTTYYFDRASGLLVKIEYPMETTLGPGVQEVFLRDYRAAGGVLFPHVQVRREMGREMTLTFKSVEYNVEIPANRLALPDAIRKIAGTAK